MNPKRAFRRWSWLLLIAAPIALALAFTQRPEAMSNQDADQAVVRTMTIDEIIQLQEEGARVVFIDAREIREYREGHIPGAHNLPLWKLARDTDSAPISELAAADLVVPYCAKDFRGFEVARALREHGVQNVALMAEHGLAAWTREGLPIERTEP
ncbi:MAG: rhodanese-like domain-containing protein [Pseudomonadota bacterium]|jgi:rhodanese-related sulfurtransferase|nr:rhodanese-like domain-containing protein [Pseudomonadota bacterium]